MIKKTLLFLTLLNFVYAQDISRVSLTTDQNTFYIPSYNFQGTVYISVKHLAEALGMPYKVGKENMELEISFLKYNVQFTAKNPFVTIYSIETKESAAMQLTTSSHFVDDLIFVPLQQTLDLLNPAYGKSVIMISPNRLLVMESRKDEVNTLEDITLSESEKGTIIKIKTASIIKTFFDESNAETFVIKLKNTSAIESKFSDLSPVGYVKYIGVNNTNDNVDITVKKKAGNIAVEVFSTDKGNELYVQLFEREDSHWLERESEHFKIFYRENHSHLANNILMSAENALKPLMFMFDYIPKEKIIINTYDASDYGFGTTTTIPHNFIRIEIEPLEPGYEVTPYNERIQWLLSHELVHIVVNDASTGVENFFRKIFGKVPPEKTQPLTIFYSLLTNYNRYSPRWYQEAIAVFIETWFSGGYGRMLGNFDEMYFRSLVFENKDLMSDLDVETIGSHNSMFLENLFYLYGTRFVSYLSIVYGSGKVIEWFKTGDDLPYTNFVGRFEEVFGKDFDDSWEEFIKYEKKFQQGNIEILNRSELTKLTKMSNKKFGWVAQPHFDEKSQTVIFGYHRPHELAEILSLSLKNGNSEELTSLPTPSMLQVASTAFDEKNGLLFFTTNNNQLFRDIWVYDIETEEKKILFEDARIGDLTISQFTHDLWGVEHNGGVATLIISPYPYQELIPIETFPVSEEIFNLSVDASGQKLACVLRKPNGEQLIIVHSVRNLLQGNSNDYLTISGGGSPENPSWSKEGRYLYWNAYTNGVSNIYRYDFADSSIKALTHCLTGLFRPIEITSDSLFAFEFTTDGFVPVMFENKPAAHLPAVNYIGQKIIEKEPQLFDWKLEEANTKINPLTFTKEKGYSGLSHLNIQSIVPVVSGFQSQVIFGLFAHISDPLLIHDLIMEVGVSPLKETPNYPLWHFRFKYDYRQIFYIDVAHHGPEFFDLFNDRKRGMIGTQIKLGHTYYWKYDNPLKVKQATTLTFYRGIEFINDNLTRVSQPDFGVLATNLNSKNLRRSIGSSDYEYGTEFNWTLTLYGTEFENLQFALNTYAEFSDFSTWLWNHNVLQVKISGGYLHDNEKLVQAKFFFGGFGNRGIDNDEIRQYRKVFRYPGIPIYSMMADKFAKLMLENDLPPLRLSGWSFLHQLVNHIDFAIYSQGMVTRSDIGDYWIDVGGQMDIKLKHWYNLESTVSFGIAKAWSDKINDWEWFASIKLLKD